MIPRCCERGKCYIRMNKQDCESLQSDDKASAAVLHLVWGSTFQGRCGPAREIEGRNSGKDEAPKSLDCDEGVGGAASVQS